MMQPQEPRFEHPVIIAWHGKLEVVEPKAYTLQALRDGLTPHSAERITLLAHPRPAAELCRAAVESEVR